MMICAWVSEPMTGGEQGSGDGVRLDGGDDECAGDNSNDGEN